MYVIHLLDMYGESFTTQRDSFIGAVRLAREAENAWYCVALQCGNRFVKYN